MSALADRATRPRRDPASGSVLQVEDLRVYYETPGGPVKAVDGVTFEVRAGERFGLVGESGSGKSTIALALMRLIKPPGHIVSGSIRVAGRDVAKLSDEEMRKLRLAGIALVAQGAMNSLNPVTRVRDQIADAIHDHGVRLRGQRLDERIRELLEHVGLAPEVALMFPHQLSGGMKQRVCIAIAVSLWPNVILADEPTSALDVVVQRQVMETLGRLQEEVGAAVILVGHDMGLMAQFVHRVGVMYAGTLAEVSEVRDLFHRPLHPYTQLLIASLPSLDENQTELQGIGGMPPSLLNRPPGCPFRARCPKAMARCAVEEPALREVEPNRLVACHLY
ncbi:MAG: ABC transporter ATP-binding protein [Pseudonocardia sp.]|nr:ABC transporter ATP-binding protein [Pseudonocardia sp.]